MPKILKAETCSQTVLPDKSLLVEQKWKMPKKIIKCDILGNFQTLCERWNNNSRQKYVFWKKRRECGFKQKFAWKWLIGTSAL